MFLALALAMCTAWHPNSVSSSRLTVAGRDITLELRCQAATLIEACPWADADQDGALTDAELGAAQPLLQLYFARHYELTVDHEATRVELALGSVQRARDVPAGDVLVDWSARGRCDTAPHDLRVASSLFRESDPWHRDHAEIVWNGAEPVSRLLWIEDAEWEFAPGETARASVFGGYVRLGVEHILTGYDHIAFLVALLVASRRVRALVGVVTAFTIAHSVTLALAAFGVVDVSAALVEPVIALSIAWVGVRATFASPPARLWPEAFGFGLVHGLGFAGSIAETLAAEPERLVALVGFNAGVELGQLAIVAACVLVLTAVARSRRAAGHVTDELTLAPSRVRRGAGFVVALLGVYWFAVRVYG